MTHLGPRLPVFASVAGWRKRLVRLAGIMAMGRGEARFSAAPPHWWRSPWLHPLPGFLLLAALSVPPFLYALYLSFVDIDISVPNRPVHFVALENYGRVLFTHAGLHALGMTLLVSFGSTALAIVVGFVLAYLIHQHGGRLSGLLTVLILIPLAVSPVVMAMVFSLMLDPLYGPIPQIIAALGGPLISPTGTAAGALLTVIAMQTWQWSPLAVVLFVGALKSLPKETLEAATIDGADAWNTLWHIRLPLLRPIIAVTAIFEFILCSQVFAATELLTNGGPGNATVDLSLFIYKIGISESGQVSLAAAAGVITLALGILRATVWLKVAKWDMRIYR